MPRRRRWRSNASGSLSLLKNKFRAIGGPGGTTVRSDRRTNNTVAFGGRRNNSATRRSAAPVLDLSTGGKAGQPYWGSLPPFDPSIGGGWKCPPPHGQSRARNLGSSRN